MSFLGKDGFVWWVGVVEDRFDPKYLGRCRVRILGWHTKDKSVLPTDALPWSMPIQPITSAAQTGVGTSPTGPVEGTWVFGFYRDGEDAQEPMILGTMGGIPQEIGNSNEGFNDPRAELEYRPVVLSPDGKVVDKKYSPKVLTNVPRDPDYLNTVYNPGQKVLLQNRGLTEDDPISTYPDSRYVQRKEPTTPRLARGVDEKTAHNTVDKMGQYRPIDGPLFSKEQTHLSSVEKARGGPDITDPDYSEPSIKFSGLYPYNHVHQSESGHVIEIDDTPNHERLHWFHRSGSFQEMKSDGDVITKSVGDLFHSALHDYYETVQNEKFTTVSGAYELFVNSSKSSNEDFYVKVGSGSNLVLRTDDGQINLSAPDNAVVTRAGSSNSIYTKNVSVTTNEDFNVDAGNIAIDADGNITFNADGRNQINGNPLILDSDGQTSIKSQSLTHTIAEKSVENIQPIKSFENPVAKEIKAVFGKIEVTSVDTTLGGIELMTGISPLLASSFNMGTGGDVTLTSYIGEILTVAIEGDITTQALAGDIITSASTGNIETTADLGNIEIKASVGSIEQEATKDINLTAKGNVLAKATTIAQIMGQALKLNTDTTEQPVIQGQKFMEEFTKHQHATGTGPSGQVLNAAPYVSTLSKKVFSG